MLHRHWTRMAVIAALLGSALGPGSTALGQDEAAAIYHLPAPAGTSLLVSQGQGEAAYRSAAEDHAFDFVAAEGPAPFTVVAARGGTVIAARSELRGGRCRQPGRGGLRPDCWQDVNHVLIDHGDGTSGLYLHLRPGRLPVRRGDIVSAGQPLGSAGSSGWTDEMGVQFQVQRTPTWNQRGSGGWFLTASRRVSFSDPDVLARHPDGVPQTGDTVVSGNLGPNRGLFRLSRRPVGLPATVPFEIGARRRIAAAYEADSPDGYGIRFAPRVDAPVATPASDPLASPGTVSAASPPAMPSPGAAVETPTRLPVSDPGTIVRPLFGGELAFAGCATGASASLGRTVIIRRVLPDGEYLAVLGHLSEIEPSLLDLDPAAMTVIIGPNEFLGRYGAILEPGETSALECPAGDPADPAADELFAAILRGATVTPAGEIIGGKPISPEPLIGAAGYEGFAWWPGPLTARAIKEEPGRPRARWSARTPAHGSHIVFGEPIDLVARVVDVTDISQVRFRAHYPGWPRLPGSASLGSFDPRTAWRQLGVCRPQARGERTGSPCRWNAGRRQTLVVFTWDPTAAPAQPSAPWLPRARPAMTRAETECVPVSLAVEVIDGAGHVYSEIGDLPLPVDCEERTGGRRRTGRVLYLDPLVPPRAPAARFELVARPWPPVGQTDPLDGDILWRDRSNNEEGFRIYARRSWFDRDCKIRNGRWQLVTEVPADTRRYHPLNARVARSLEAPDIKGVPGFMDRWEYSVSAFNEVGETRRVRVGGFFRGDAPYCGPGLEPPPDEEEPAPDREEPPPDQEGLVPEGEPAP
jgi:hypothetical protein